MIKIAGREASFFAKADVLRLISEKGAFFVVLDLGMIEIGFTLQSFPIWE